MGAANASKATDDRMVLGKYLGVEMIAVGDELPEALADAIATLESEELFSLAEAVRLCARRAGIVLPKGGK